MANAKCNLYTIRILNVSTNKFILVLSRPYSKYLTFSSQFLSIDKCILEARISKRTTYNIDYL